MRQIETKMLAAIKACKNWKNGNTEVYFSDGTSKMPCFSAWALHLLQVR